MKVVKKLLAPVLVVGLLLTSLVSLHHLKDNKKSNVLRIGISQYITHKSLDATRKGFIAELKKAGYVDGKNIQIDFQNAQGEQRNLKNISKQLAEESDLVFAIATPSAQSLANTTKTTPVVFSAVTDPLAAKLVKNLKEPGGNITGVSDHNPTEQQLKLIKELTPNVKTIGVLYSTSEDNSKSQVEEFTKLAEKAGYKVVPYSVPSTNEIASTVSVMSGKVDAIWVPIDNTIASAFSTVVEANKTAKKPLFPSATAMVEAGGLGSVVVDQHDLGVATGKMAAKILKGQKPADTPVEIFSNGKSVINKKVADELGITIPESVLKDAGQVIK